MDANLIDLCILLGYSKMESVLNDKCSRFIDISAMNKTPFIKHLPKLVLKLLEKNCLRSKIFDSFFNLFKLMKKESKRGGQCPICGKYCSRIRDHYRKFHRMTPAQMQSFFSVISDGSIFYMPNEHKLPKNSEMKSIDNEQKSNSSIDEVKCEVSSELINGYYTVKNQESDEEKLICADCGHIISKKQASKHKKNHRKHKKY